MSVNSAIVAGTKFTKCLNHRGPQQAAIRFIGGCIREDLFFGKRFEAFSKRSNVRDVRFDLNVFLALFLLKLTNGGDFGDLDWLARFRCELLQFGDQSSDACVGIGNESVDQMRRIFQPGCSRISWRSRSRSRALFPE